MTPFEIGILFHISYSRSVPKEAGAPIYRDTMDELESLSLIKPSIANGSGYDIDERGIVYLKAIRELPLPVWKMPKESDK